MARFTTANSFPTLIAIATIALASSVTSQFMYTHQPFDAVTVMLVAFLEPVCPDSRDSWGPLKEAFRYYIPHVLLVVYLLPLSGASPALHIVNMLKNDSTFPLLELFFDQQEKFYNIHPMNMSRASVVKAMAKFSTQVVGNSFYNAIEAGFNNRLTDLKTRVSFKYSNLNSVDSTPSFFLNGFLLPGAGSPIDFKGWKSFIVPLIGSRKE